MRTYRRERLATAAELPSSGWRKSRRSGSSGDCIEAASSRGRVRVRDSKHRDGPALAFTSETWAEFVADLKREQLYG